MQEDFGKFITEIKIGEVTIWLLSLREISAQALEELYAYCDKERKEKIKSSKSELKRKQSAGAGYLLYLLKKKFSLETEVAIRPGGKPVFQEDTGIYFSISHSGEFAALAFGKRDLGMDIECVKKERENVARRFFTKEEYQWIEKKEQPERDDAFFQVWTKKEALVKASGEGLKIPLDSFSVLPGVVELSGKRYVLSQQLYENDARKVWIAVAKQQGDIAIGSEA